MRFKPATNAGNAADAVTMRARSEHGRNRIGHRVQQTIAMCQAVLVVRIITVLLFIGLLPASLPMLAIRIDSSHNLVLPLSGMNRDLVLLVVAAASALELYLVHRLADRRQWARLGVIAVEPVVITATTVALALGATVAALPLALSVGGTCLLLLNQVRWAFRLRSEHLRLTGRRRGGVFAGYAPLAPDAPKPAQPVGYSVENPPRD